MELDEIGSAFENQLDYLEAKMRVIIESSGDYRITQKNIVSIIKI